MLAVLMWSCAVLAAGPVAEPSVVKTTGDACRHGLSRQPGNGPFAVMVFCDDAAGTHIGVICYAAGSRCEEGPWTLDGRFWQEGAWADDVTAFAWDPNGKCLYVSTAEVYGAGDVFVLNLPTRTYKAVTELRAAQLIEKQLYTTYLSRLDATGRLLEYTLTYFDDSKHEVVSESKTLEMKQCGDK